VFRGFGGASSVGCALAAGVFARRLADERWVGAEDEAGRLPNLLHPLVEQGAEPIAELEGLLLRQEWFHGGGSRRVFAQRAGEPRGFIQERKVEATEACDGLALAV
jgi:hypothetical protein